MVAQEMLIIVNLGQRPPGVSSQLASATAQVWAAPLYCVGFVVLRG